ncbi:YigZ family protein [Actinotignum timonense]|uniref:YigZ family protein n=1 Tax=Actinotignum timonense TaxID=1870995 RepID=UPI002A824316|nr:YigZ family protein [Actinotignum timonense]MDY5139097.1 YigZ family protein [Actinotignum timonense]
MQTRRYAAILAAAARQKLSRRAVPQADELPRVKVHAVAERAAGEGVARFAGGGVGGHAPAALLHQLCLGPTLDILADSRLPLVATGAVITDLRWEILSPVPFGRPLTVRAWVASFERDEKGTALLVAADILYDGAVCYREIARYLDRGTAGRPMLDTLLGAGITDVVAVVTRYFGGTLLGTGGLVRAYSDSVTQALGQARMVERRVVPRYRAFLPHSDAGKYIATLSGAGFTPEMDYHDHGVELHISTERGAALAAMMAELSAGNVGVEQIEDAIIEVPLPG